MKKEQKTDGPLLLDEEISKLRKVIDLLRAKASDSDYTDYLKAWLKDPSIDNWGVEKLLSLRYAISRLSEECESLSNLSKHDKTQEGDHEDTTPDMAM